MNAVNNIVQAYVASETARVQYAAAGRLLRIASQTGSNELFASTRQTVRAAAAIAESAARAVAGLAGRIDVLG